MSIVPMPPEKVEASIFAQLIIQNWIEEIRALKREAADAGLRAERHTLEHSQWMLQACEKLFDAAMRGDYEFLTAASKGIEGAPVRTDKEEWGDILMRISKDLAVIFDGEFDKHMAVVQLIKGLDNGSLVLPSFKEPAPAPTMNRAARRRAARGR